MQAFRSIARTHYKEAQGAIVMFNLTSRASFDYAKTWVEELQGSGPPELVIALVGGQCDRPQRQVSPQEAQKYAASIKNTATGLEAFYTDTSAKTNTGVESAFTELSRRMLEVHKQALARKERGAGAKNAPGERDVVVQAVSPAPGQAGTLPPQA